VICSSHGECSPGERCGPSSGGCGVGVAGCCDVPGGTPAYQACCIRDPSITDVCWEPGDTRG
jgi:hypothetical protein